MCVLGCFYSCCSLMVTVFDLQKPVVAKGLNGQLLRMHVMLVDDMKPIRRLVRAAVHCCLRLYSIVTLYMQGESFLEKLGCTSVLLEDGDEIDGALDTSTRPFDAILLDISMNRTDGAQVCQHLRQDLKVHCPIIAMTAKISNVDTQRYYKMGFDLVTVVMLLCCGR